MQWDASWRIYHSKDKYISCILASQAHLSDRQSPLIVGLRTLAGKCKSWKRLTSLKNGSWTVRTRWAGGSQEGRGIFVVLRKMWKEQCWHLLCARPKTALLRAKGARRLSWTSKWRSFYLFSGLGGTVFPGRWAFLPAPQSLKRPRTEPQQPTVNHIQKKQLRYSDRLHSQQGRASGQLVERLRVVNRETQGFRAPNPLSRALDNRGQDCGCLASPRTLTWPQV